MTKHLNSRRIVVISIVVLCLLLQVFSVFAAEQYPTLKFRSRGEAVVRLQKELAARGFLKGPADGIYGPQTEKAVINFQKWAKIRIDGVAGKETHASLFGNQVPTRGAGTSRNTSSADLYWLSRIIHSESASEPYNGKVAVGNVVLNRVQSKSFPNSVYGVIFEYYKNIPQFSPVADGTIYNTPSEESVRAARDSLNGVKPVGNATYFFNPSKAEGRWIVQNKTYVMRIGGHVFYR
jgi:N-acetylmuramoyl-L-alanine amidase